MQTFSIGSKSENIDSGNLAQISVILPVYNSESFISEAVESILNQTYDKFEFIIIDDGSTDNTLQILKAFAARDSRVRLISRENRGVVATMNEAISLSKNKWIALMNADDISLPIRFDKQLKFLEESGLDICGSYIEFFGSGINQVVKYPVNDSQIKISLLFESPFANPSIMMRATLAKKILYREEFAKGAEDYDFWVRAAILGAKMSNLSEVLLKYRQHDSQMTNLYENNNQLLSNIVRRNYWNFISQTIPLQQSGINEILSSRFNSSNSKLSNDFKIAFRDILSSTSTDNHLIVFKSLSRLLFRVAHNNFSALLIWLDLTKLFNFRNLNHVKYIILFIYLFKLRPNNFIYMRARNIFLKFLT